MTYKAGGVTSTSCGQQGTTIPLFQGTGEVRAVIGGISTRMETLFPVVKMTCPWPDDDLSAEFPGSGEQGHKEYLQ